MTAMAPTSTNTTCILPPVSGKPCRRGRNRLGKRAAPGVDGLLQVGEINARRRSGLKESPSWSPAFLLAALEWAEVEEEGDAGDSNAEHGHGAGRGLAQKSALARRPKPGTNDVNLEFERRITAGAPQLSYPSRKTPAFYKPYKPPYTPAPPSLCLDTTVEPVPAPSPIGPDLRSRYRGRQRRLQQYHPQQQRNGVGQRPQRRAQLEEVEETKALVDAVAQLGGDTGCTLAEQSKARSKQNMARPMQPSAAPPSPAATASPTASLSHCSRMFERVASLARRRKKSNAESPPKSTPTKRSYMSPISPLSPISTTSNGAPADLARPDSLDFGRMPYAATKTTRGDDIATIDAPRGASNSAEQVSGVWRALYYPRIPS